LFRIIPRKGNDQAADIVFFNFDPSGFSRMYLTPSGRDQMENDIANTGYFQRGLMIENAVNVD
jgi:hypothetical protein